MGVNELVQAEGVDPKTPSLVELQFQKPGAEDT